MIGSLTVFKYLDFREGGVIGLKNILVPNKHIGYVILGIFLINLDWLVQINSAQTFNN